MKNISILFMACFLLSGCATIPNQRVGAQVRPIIETHLQYLKEKRYEDSYRYFSKRLKSEISLNQHMGFMKIVEKELGDIETYRLVHNPFRFSILDEDAFEEPFQYGYVWYQYKVKFSRTTTHISMNIIKENGEFKIDSFGIADDRFYKDERLQNQVRTLGIKINKSTEEENKTAPK